MRLSQLPSRSKAGGKRKSKPGGLEDGTKRVSRRKKFVAPSIGNLPSYLLKNEKASDRDKKKKSITNTVESVLTRFNEAKTKTDPARRKTKKGFIMPRIIDAEALEKALGKTKEAFEAEFNARLCGLGIMKPRASAALHDPSAENALVLYTPIEETANMEEELEQELTAAEGDDDDTKSPSPAACATSSSSDVKAKKKKKRKKKQVHIVVDPKLTKVLRPHQREGVEFVFGCLMGLRHNYGEGCILADDMGLGKTLQAIAVMWTLLTQGIYGTPTCNNGVIISPASLVGNWDVEITKWLGDNSIATFPCLSNTKKVIKSFMQCHKSRKPVLIISYESFREHAKTITSKAVGFVVCDEGHKLKNHKSNLSKSVKTFGTLRRLLLSGTPIQNNLDEMYSLVSFVNPSVWDSYQGFREFARSIERSLDFSVSEKLKSKGEEATSQVRKILNQFLLQRTNVVVRKYLPQRTEYVIFCRLTELQLELYKKFLHSKTVRKAKASVEGNSSSKGGLNAMGFLACGVLCKICNHPSLLYDAAANVAGVRSQLVLGKSRPSSKKKKKDRKSDCTDCEYDEGGARVRTELKGLYDIYPAAYSKKALCPEYSSKCLFVLTLLLSLKRRTDDKVVIVSVYVETLDLLAVILEQNNIRYLRLDGSIPTKKRQGYVDEFNDASSGVMVLLLSNRAGGCGLNLIGANRLVMFDPDWNPANDAQAMARVWRSGQKKHTFIYRLLSTGSIEEKMFQRQTFKMDMAEQIVAAEACDVTEFVVKELKAIFTLNEATKCDTLDRMKGSRGFVGWERMSQFTNVGDPFLTGAARAGKLSYLFKRDVNKPTGDDDDDDDCKSSE